MLNMIKINYKYLYSITLWITSIGLLSWTIDKVLYFNNIYFTYSDIFHNLAHILLSGSIFLIILSLLLYIFKIQNRYLYFFISILSFIGAYTFIGMFEWNIGEQHSGTTDMNVVDSFYDFIGVLLMFMWLIFIRRSFENFRKNF